MDIQLSASDFRLMYPVFIRVLLFDLGGTLMYARDPWPPILERADHALIESLRAQGLTLEREALYEEFHQRLSEYRFSRNTDLFEITTFSVLRGLLTEKGYASLPEWIIRSALDAMYAVTQLNWELEEDAIPTLKELERRGYRLGMVSNAGDNKDVIQLAERFGIETYFDFILTSATCSYRKPHARIFELALSHWQMRPQEAAMVGDMLAADIAGANGAGIYSIWITRRVERPADGEEIIQPKATIASLNELPALLNSLRRGQ